MQDQTEKKAEPSSPEIFYFRSFDRLPVSIIQHDRRGPDRRAHFAFALLEKWGLVLAKDGGEDSAGRAKLAPLSAKETVDHAFDIAEEAFRQMEARGCFVEMPDYETCIEKAREASKRN